jgi:hypothetical protein
MKLLVLMGLIPFLELTTVKVVYFQIVVKDVIQEIML